MSGLVTFFKGREDENSHASLLSQAIHAYLKGEERVEALLFGLLEECASSLLETPEDILDYYRTLSAVLFMKEGENDRLDQAIRPLLKRGIIEGYWKTFQLQEGYRALCSFLFEGKRTSFKVKQLEKAGN